MNRILLALLLFVFGSFQCTTSVTDGGSITVTTANLVKLDDQFFTILIPSGTCTFYAINEVTSEYFIKPVTMPGPNTWSINRSCIRPGNYLVSLKNLTTDSTYNQEITIYQ
jgi:hypothetical protein